jgi:hypothetical protein
MFATQDKRKLATGNVGIGLNLAAVGLTAGEVTKLPCKIRHISYTKPLGSRTLYDYRQIADTAVRYVGAVAEKARRRM